MQKNLNFICNAVVELAAVILLLQKTII